VLFGLLHQHRRVQLLLNRVDGRGQLNPRLFDFDLDLIWIVLAVIRVVLAVVTVPAGVGRPPGRMT